MATGSSRVKIYLRLLALSFLLLAFPSHPSRLEVLLDLPCRIDAGLVGHPHTIVLAVGIDLARGPVLALPIKDFAVPHTLVHEIVNHIVKRIEHVRKFLQWIEASAGGSWLVGFLERIVVLLGGGSGEQRLPLLATES